jgi:hypothetical protein
LQVAGQGHAFKALVEKPTDSQTKQVVRQSKSMEALIKVLTKSQTLQLAGRVMPARL